MIDGNTKDPMMISGDLIRSAIAHLKRYNMYGLADEVEQMQRQRATLLIEAKESTDALEQANARIDVGLRSERNLNERIEQLEAAIRYINAEMQEAWGAEGYMTADLKSAIEGGMTLLAGYKSNV